MRRGIQLASPRDRDRDRVVSISTKREREREREREKERENVARCADRIGITHLALSLSFSLCVSPFLVLKFRHGSTSENRRTPSTFFSVKLVRVKSQRGIPVSRMQNPRWRSFLIRRGGCAAVGGEIPLLPGIRSPIRICISPSARCRSRTLTRLITPVRGWTRGMPRVYSDRRKNE